ncbi:pathogenicity determinant protein PdpA1, partial [Francisella tularensis subsp. holarctica]|nr:pathogenicity determinant protein PdpA1 [Francisella tularensis subsp. holarctica]
IIKQLNKLKSSLSRYIGYNTVLQKQEITINIKPINKNFELEDISFVSTRNKQYFKHNSLTLKNHHIEKLEVCENIYGINGWLTF